VTKFSPFVSGAVGELVLREMDAVAVRRSSITVFYYAGLRDLRSGHPEMNVNSLPSVIFGNLLLNNEYFIVKCVIYFIV
jgi:hypothetical protein